MIDLDGPMRRKELPFNAHRVYNTDFVSYANLLGIDKLQDKIQSIDIDKFDPYLEIPELIYHNRLDLKKQD